MKKIILSLLVLILTASALAVCPGDPGCPAADSGQVQVGPSDGSVSPTAGTGTAPQQPPTIQENLKNAKTVDDLKGVMNNPKIEELTAAEKQTLLNHPQMDFDILSPDEQGKYVKMAGEHLSSTYQGKKIDISKDGKALKNYVGLSLWSGQGPRPTFDNLEKGSNMRMSQDGKLYNGMEFIDLNKVKLTGGKLTPRGWPKGGFDFSGGTMNTDEELAPEQQAQGIVPKTIEYNALQDGSFITVKQKDDEKDEYKLGPGATMKIAQTEGNANSEISITGRKKDFWGTVTKVEMTGVQIDDIKNADFTAKTSKPGKSIEATGSNVNLEGIDVVGDKIEYLGFSQGKITAKPVTVDAIGTKQATQKETLIKKESIFSGHDDVIVAAEMPEDYAKLKDDYDKAAPDKKKEALKKFSAGESVVVVTPSSNFIRTTTPIKVETKTDNGLTVSVHNGLGGAYEQSYYIDSDNGAIIGRKDLTAKGKMEKLTATGLSAFSFGIPFADPLTYLATESGISVKDKDGKTLFRESGSVVSAQTELLAGTVVQTLNDHMDKTNADKLPKIDIVDDGFLGVTEYKTEPGKEGKPELVVERGFKKIEFKHEDEPEPQAQDVEPAKPSEQQQATGGQASNEPAVASRPSEDTSGSSTPAAPSNPTPTETPTSPTATPSSNPESTATPAPNTIQPSVVEVYQLKGSKTGHWGAELNPNEEGFRKVIVYTDGWINIEKPTSYGTTDTYTYRFDDKGTVSPVNSMMPFDDKMKSLVEKYQVAGIKAIDSAKTTSK